MLAIMLICLRKSIRSRVGQAHSPVEPDTTVPAMLRAVSPTRTCLLLEVI
ncbi:hypothetical protein HMPREF9056_02111 [Actinomyces sp. oral taxon 170 str. F0386]|nr:hypothetical protein HMPREF9056_02111 [Actinomyces sp. oral taxon 170 str. F0386]